MIDWNIGEVRYYPPIAGGCFLCVYGGCCLYEKESPRAAVLDALYKRRQNKIDFSR